MAHYKYKKGLVSFEEMAKAVDRLHAMNSVKRALFMYFVDGKSIKETKVNSSLLIPYLNQVNELIGDNLHNYRERFLYTHEFNPNVRQGYNR